MTGKIKACLICESSRLDYIHPEKKPWLVQCGNCGFVFSSWIPSDEELAEYYRDYTDYDYVNDVTRNRYLQWVDGLEKFRRTNRILDVGCGDGIFLEQAKKRGWDVHGTEYAEKWVNRCREKGISMIQGKMDPSNYEAGSFDAVIYMEVIEHINNPREELDNARKVLRDGGVVFLTTPNYNSITRRLLSTDWNVICYPEHLSYYTPRTLAKLFTENGFEKIAIHTKGVSPGRLMSSIKFGGNESINPTDMIRGTDQKLRVTLESNRGMKFMKDSINLVLRVTRLGDSMHAWFRKKTETTR
jgi:2-polyprenyl-3-methyl-5-hydroxy-6-metoxy-1,4-benzoquinol methylase